MRNIVSIREEQGGMTLARLQSIWYVDADRSYLRRCVSRMEDCGYVAVRTLTGRGRLELFGGSVFFPGPGSLCFFRTEDIACYEAEDEGWEFYWFKFDMQAGELKGMNRVHEIRLSAQERGELERCFMGLSSRSQAEAVRAEALFNYLLADWQVRTAENQSGGMAAEEIVSLLEMGRRGQMSIAEMARRAGMCERSFRDAVRRATGLSPKAYMIKGEMVAAMELLRTSEMSVSEIAACFNYTDPFYFSRTFKKYYGISPQHVREGIKL